MGEEKAARASAEVSKLLAELANVSDSASSSEKTRAALAKQNADMAVRLEEAEAGGSRTIKAQMRKLENRIAELESDLDTEARKSANVIKSTRKAEKRVKELEGTLEDERKAAQSSVASVELTTNKMKLLRV